MARLDVIFERRKANRVQLDSVVLDASVSESHSAAAQVTDHPVESGVDISDHVIQKPDEIEISGVVTNTPIEILERVGGLLEGAASGGFAGLASAAFDPHRAEEAYEELRKLKAAGDPVTIATGLRTYERMVITRLQVTRDATTGDAVSLAISAREVKTVESVSVAVDPAILRAKPRKNRGRQTPAPASAETAAKAEEQKSILSGWVNSAFGIQ